MSKNKKNNTSKAKTSTKNTFFKPPKLTEEQREELAVKKPNRTNNRKNKYEYWLTKDGLLLLESWSRDGSDLQQIAKKMGIAPKTLYAWITKYEAIGKAIKKTQELANLEVENALFKRAIGYNEIVKEAMKVKQGSYEEIVYVEKVIHIPGEVSAQIFYLTNRKPERWTNTQARKVQLAEPVSAALISITENLNRIEITPTKDDLVDLSKYRTKEENADGTTTSSN